MKRIFLITTLLVLLFTGQAIAKNWPAQTNVPLDKVWTVRFSEPIKTIDNTYEMQLLTLDSNGNAFGDYIEYSQDMKTVILRPYETYKPNTTYYMHITNKIQSESGKNLTEPITMQFTTVNNPNNTITKIIFIANSSEYLIDNTKCYSNAPTAINNGHILIPLRLTAQALGFNTTWDGTTKTATFLYGKKPDTKITMQAGSFVMNQNENLVVMESPLMIVDGLTMVPVKYLAEAFELEYKESINSIEIYKTGN